MRIEPATSAHAEAIAAVYDEAARTTPATFDLEGHPPQWWADVIAAGDYPFVVAVDGRRCSASPAASLHKVKPAYATTCETSVYVAESARGRGAGRALYDALLADARRRARIPARGRGHHRAQPGVGRAPHRLRLHARRHVPRRRRASSAARGTSPGTSARSASAATCVHQKIDPLGPRLDVLDVPAPQGPTRPTRSTRGCRSRRARATSPHLGVSSTR